MIANLDRERARRPYQNSISSEDILYTDFRDEHVARFSPDDYTIHSQVHPGTGPDIHDDIPVRGHLADPAMHCMERIVMRKNVGIRERCKGKAPDNGRQNLRIG